MKNEADNNQTDERFLLVRAGPATVAVHGQHVLSVGEIREITALPLMPGAISGVCAYEGRVLPVFNLGVTLDENAPPPRCLIEISAGDSQLLVAADEARQWVHADQVTATDIADEEQAGLLFRQQILVEDHSHSILEPSEILSLFSSLDLTSETSGYLARKEDDEQDSGEQHQRFLFVEQGGIRFALDASHVEQIEQAGDIDSAPGSAAFQVGFAIVHHQPVAVYSLMDAIEQQQVTLSDNAHLVVVSQKGRCLAFAVDRVDAFHDVPESHIHPADNDNALVQSLIRDSNDNLLALIDLDAFFRDYAASTFALSARESGEETSTHIHHFLSIEVGEAPYLLDADIISRITAYTPPTELGEEAGDGVDGITALEGTTALTLDMQQLLGHACKQPAYYAICQIDDISVALAVDAADRLLAVPGKHIDTLHGSRRSRRVARMDSGSREVLDSDQLRHFLAARNHPGAAPA